MKIYVVVKYEDIEVIDPLTGEDSEVTTTEILNAYGSLQDAKFEAKYLKADNKLDNIAYDVVVTELY